ncbi:MAG TPA: amino acid adenylation domain-containing protein, partial [Thermoanaerobaculia bacterium]|nr:amino acid adenylation domain-containing protein [Thermoanaerobaculia bacterium]
VVGSPVANRRRGETEGLIGLFINTLALRTRLDGDPSFTELLARVRETALAAFAHQDLPFERLVEELAPQRSLAHTPLFQVLFALNNAPLEPLSLPGLRLEPLPPSSGIARFDLALWLRPEAGGIAGELECSTDLFDPTTAERWLRAWTDLLALLPVHLETRLSALPRLSPAERQALLCEWNDTATAAVVPVPAAIATRGASAPEALALCCGEEHLSYGAVVERADRLARRLRRLGVGPETRVGVALERGVGLPVALLAVWRAEGAYVPLDPDYPAERLAYVLGDSGAALVLVAGEATFEGGGSCPQLRIDLPAPDLSASEGAVPEPSAPAAGDLAYVLYTSGSTGRPKGVEICHGALANFLAGMARFVPLGPADRLLAVTTVAFDIAGLELFGPLAAGGTVELADRETTLDGARLAERLASATLMQATPATWRLLLRSGWGGSPHLRALVGGEALPRELADGLLPRVAELWNLYGPTETTVWSSVSRVRPGSGPPPIGRPIANTLLALLGPDLRAQPLGVPGELVIGGEGVARGYLGRPALTAERFVPDGLGGGVGARLYRTGDLARWQPDGELVFLRRIDQQVKIRGFRIELGEVETALASHPDLRQAVVVVREGPDGEALLAAYLVARGEAPEAAALRQFLARSLPAYMLPATFTVLAAFPLTANGKVDRRALPAPGAPEPAAGEAPRTPVEELVAGIWSELLAGAAVDRRTSFFEAGGHSLLAAQAVARVREALGVEVPVKSLFEAPTLGEWAGLVEALRQGGEPPLPALEVVPGPPVASAAQERLWFLEQLDPGRALYNLPLALDLGGSLEVAALAAALGEVVRRHQTLRTAFLQDEGRLRLALLPERPPALPVVDLTALAAEEAEGLARELLQREIERPFALEAGLLLRGLLVRCSASRHLLGLTLHHIAGDAWSIGLLMTETAALYRAFQGGEPSPLAEPALQYADFARWQRRSLTGPRLEAGLAFWRRHLEGAPALLNLPIDRPRPRVQSLTGDHLRLPLAAGTAASLARLGRQRGVTLFMALLAAFEVLLARMTGQTDLVVGAPIANRPTAATEGLIGFFVNTLALRGRLEGDPTFAVLLAQARSVALDAWAHPDLPFELLVEELGVERDLAHSPVFQVMLVLQNAPLGAVSLPGLTLAPVWLAPRVARFDLTLAMVEEAGELAVEVEYRSDLFDRTTVLRLAGHWRTLLAALEGDVDRPVLQLPLLSAAERHQLERELADTARARPQGVRVEAAIAEQAVRTPDAVALVFAEARLSYGALLAAATALAATLAERGVGPEERVGIAVERSPEAVVGILAILAAGAAYVPFDLAFPAERLAFLAADAGVRLLLARRAQQEQLALPGVATLDLDEAVPAAGAAVPPSALASAIGDRGLAYVIYTSGSTGRPKGVMVTHRGICNRLRWSRDAYGIGERDAFLQKASIGFDVSVWECFGALTAGARLALAEPGRQAEGDYLVRALCEHGITFVDFVPSMLAAFVEEEGVETCVSLRQILAGGEALSPELRDRTMERLPTAVLDNGYGPTEATIDATRWVCAPGQAPHRVPIGRPIGNTRLYVVDRELRPMPAGVAGELAVGGAGVSRGYLRRPGLTAERFVPDPFGGQPGDRLYRTGDLVRWLPDGTLDFLGRLDHQVKVRGFRIELGEIETALVALPGVRDAVVVLRDQKLVAYVVGDAAVEELRRGLGERLPDYMVPA